MTELETLKAQLAHSESIRHAEKRILLTEIRMRAASEAKVRELRELLSSIQLVASAPWTSQSWMTFRKLIDEAALRSAPPSERETSSQALRDSTKHVHDENETNAGEERKDLAKVPAAPCKLADSSVGDGVVTTEHLDDSQGTIPAEDTSSSRLRSTSGSAHCSSKAGLGGETAPTADGLSPQDSPVCDRCGGNVPVWFAPTEVWNAVIPTRQAMLCVHCFIAAAEASWIQCTGWQLTPESWSGPQDSPSRSPTEQLAKEIYALVKDVETMRLVELYAVAKGREIAQDILNVTPTRSFAVEKSSEWISVETRLPESENDYNESDWLLLYFDLGYSLIGFYGAGHPEQKQGWYGRMADGTGAHRIATPSHWQPLPPSPAREKEPDEAS